MKYLRHKSQGFVVFDAISFSHESMMRKMGWAKEDLLSAGRIKFDEDVIPRDGLPLDGLYCYGSSTMLRLHVSDDDTEQLHWDLRMGL